MCAIIVGLDARMHVPFWDGWLATMVVLGLREDGMASVIGRRSLRAES